MNGKIKITQLKLLDTDISGISQEELYSNEVLNNYCQKKDM